MCVQTHANIKVYTHGNINVCVCIQTHGNINVYTNTC